jgi:hypothetical protein
MNSHKSHTADPVEEIRKAEEDGAARIAKAKADSEKKLVEVAADLEKKKEEFTEGLRSKGKEKLTAVHKEANEALKVKLISATDEKNRLIAEMEKRKPEAVKAIIDHFLTSTKN